MSDDDDVDIDDAIADYRAELLASAALDEAEIAELEDHLRELIVELRGTSATTAAVIARARQRLGEPRAVAIECARVRTAFGTRIAPARAWSAGVLLAGLTAWTAWQYLARAGLVSRIGAEIVLGAILIAGLCARRVWPRAVLFGHAISMTLTCIPGLWLWHDPTGGVAFSLAAFAGVAVLLAPWRRGELTAAGWALAAWSIAYAGASYGVFEAIMHRGLILWFLPTSPITLGPNAIGAHALIPALAMIGVAIAALGTVVRARWSALAGACTAALLALTLIGVASVGDTGFPTVDAQHGVSLAVIATGLVAAIAATILGWRGSRRGIGDVRSLVTA